MACIHCKRTDKYLKTHFHVGGLLYWIIALHCCCSWGGNPIRHHSASDHYNAGRQIMKTSGVGRLLEGSMLLSFTYCCSSAKQSLSGALAHMKSPVGSNQNRSICCFLWKVHKQVLKATALPYCCTPATDVQWKTASDHRNSIKPP